MKDNESLNAIDRFLYKFLICIILLLAVILLDKIKVVKLEKVREPFSEHINILPFLKIINGKEGFLLPVDISDQVNAPTYQSFQNAQIIKNGRLIVLDDFQGVENYMSGVVVKIARHNGLFEVTIKGIDGYEYVYNNLENVDVNIYKFLKSGDIIGLPGSYEGINFFRFYVYSQGEPINIFP